MLLKYYVPEGGMSYIVAPCLFHVLYHHLDTVECEEAFCHFFNANLESPSITVSLGTKKNDFKTISSSRK
jgi:hypothetical protein